MSVNKAILVGNLGRDPETKVSAGGMTICKLSLATSSRRKGPDGEYSDHTEWHRVAVFGKTAESVGKYLKKGSKVYIEGEIRTQKWTHKDGADRWSTEIVANVVRFLDSKSDGGGERSQPSRQDRKPSGGGGRQNQTSGGGDFDDQDIPF